MSCIGDVDIGNIGMLRVSLAQDVAERLFNASSWLARMSGTIGNPSLIYLFTTPSKIESAE